MTPGNPAPGMIQFELTGNDYVSIPRIHPDGAVAGVNVLHAGLAGLVEWAGDETAPFLQLGVTVDGQRVSLDGAQWRRLDRWIPTFQLTTPLLMITGTICAPAGYPPARGFMLRLELENRGRSAAAAEIDLNVCWAATSLCVGSNRPLPGTDRMIAAGNDDVLILETNDGRGPALAIGGEHAVVMTPLDGAMIGQQRTSASGTPLRAHMTQKIQLVPSRRTSVTFFIGAGRERDGAAMAVRVMKRSGADHWLRQARLELSHTLRAAQDHRWAELLNRNLLFCRYFAVARAIDDDRMYLVRSRSTACPDAALFNEREALLWTLPALIIADPTLAREALLRVCDVFSERSGEHVRYLEGAAYDPGFVLDHFLLYTWAISHYIAATGDDSVLDEPLIRQIVAETDAAAYMRLHPQHMLASTELLPSGDVADHPFATMANVLLWVFCDALPRLNGTTEDPKPRFSGAASEVAATIWQFCVTDIDGESVLASSANLEGDVAVYDDPALSLAMLPFFGFCATDDPVWRSTMEFLRSTRYPLWRNGAVAGLAARHDAARARLSALCADLLVPGDSTALDRLLGLQLPGGVAAGAYLPQTGMCEEPHHAALAGFLAWTLVRAAEPMDQGGTGRKRKR